MAGIRDSLIIDLVGLPPDRSTCNLYIVESENRADLLNVELINAKIKSYVAFALDGQLEASYPEIAELPVQIVFVLSFDLTPEEENALEVFRQGVAQYNIGLAWEAGKVLPS